MSTLSKIINRWGIVKGTRLYYRIKVVKPQVWTIPELKHPVFLRPNTSDRLIFKQIFGMGEYDIEFPEEPTTIIDGGSNIGLFSVLMANRYPQAQIFAIEPDEGNFLQLQKNAIFYPSITAIRAGIWNENCYLNLVDEGYGEWGLQVKKAEAGKITNVKGITLGDIVEQYGLHTLDVVKLDVEGAEAIIFHDHFEKWLALTQVLIIELHERNWPGISTNFEHCIKKYPFSKQKHGEYFIYTRQPE